MNETSAAPTAVTISREELYQLVWNTPIIRLASEALKRHGGNLGDFPVSYLGNFYCMNLAMSLSERLVSMNLDTEAVGKTYLLEVSNRLQRVGLTEIAEMYDFISRDEARHAEMGAKWFKFLCPDASTRKRALQEARALTIVRLAEAHCEVQNEQSVSDVLVRWAKGERPFLLEPFDEALHEREISLSTARDREGSISEGHC